MNPNSTPDAAPLLDDLLAGRLAAAARDFAASASREIAAGADDARFGALLSAASRHARREPLAPTPEERFQLAALLPGCEIERWTRLETLRVRLVLARRDLGQPAGVTALEACFQFADEGELCALYRSLQFMTLLPEPKRFAWRAGEGCRSNMRSVFEATACDSALPANVFDEPTFNQCVIKAIFIGAPVGRIFGLERRRNGELTRMALDLAAERKSAGRPIPADLWLAVEPSARPRT